MNERATSSHQMLRGLGTQWTDMEGGPFCSKDYAYTALASIDARYALLMKNWRPSMLLQPFTADLNLPLSYLVWRARPCSSLAAGQALDAV